MQIKLTTISIKKSFSFNYAVMKVSVSGEKMGKIISSFFNDIFIFYVVLVTKNSIEFNYFGKISKKNLV